GAGPRRGDGDGIPCRQYKAIRTSTTSLRSAAVRVLLTDDTPCGTGRVMRHPDGRGPDADERARPCPDAVSGSWADRSRSATGKLPSGPPGVADAGSSRSAW